MDTYAVLIACDGSGRSRDGPERRLVWQARLTFAMARHVIVDLAYLLNAAPIALDPERLLPDGFRDLWADMAASGFAPAVATEAVAADGVEAELRALRDQYEPFVNGLAVYLFLTLPAWVHGPNNDEAAPDNWQTSAWDDGDKQQAHF